MPQHKTSAWPLALVYTGLIVYASLYPFAHWRDQGVAWWAFLLAPLPRYWTGFDVVANVLGYMPLGFLLALSALRTGRAAHAIRNAGLAGLGLSLAMETLQLFLPDRVPSNLDLMLNAAGGGVGALSAWWLERVGLLQRWERFRADWFVEESRGALALLAIWPPALLFPTAIPFGLGQVAQRLSATLTDWFEGSALESGLPASALDVRAPTALVEWLCMALGLLIPGLLGYCVIERRAKRVGFLLWLLVLGVGATTLSAALSFGPEHAWLWFGSAAQTVLPVVLTLMLALLGLPRRGAAVLAVLALGIYLSLLNQAATNPYFEQTLFLWEQGRFIRFHGLAQWLGWIWPFATLVYVLGLALGHKPQN